MAATAVAPPSEVLKEENQSRAAKTAQSTDDSQTASEFIDHQLQLEADAREALPYSFNKCTKPLGSLRQSLFSCLTCKPPPPSPSDRYEPAGVCYSCSISCHGEHELVELFARRDFTCDCGTTKLPVTSPCTLRADPATGLKGSTHSQAPAADNTYNQNFGNRFCGCGEIYDAHQQKGTMYQCIGLATEQNGGCGEDWWHPECLLGLGRGWYEHAKRSDKLRHLFNSAKEEPGERYDDLRIARHESDSEDFVPRIFPKEDQIVTLICYKCCHAVPWIKHYAACQGFIALLNRQNVPIEESLDAMNSTAVGSNATISSKVMKEVSLNPSKKRAAEAFDEVESEPHKKLKTNSTEEKPRTAPALDACTKPQLDSISTRDFSLIASDEEFRIRFCRCSECYPLIRQYPQLLEEEEIYEPSLSEESGDEGGESTGTKSLLDRGEAALSNVDRVRAIEGVMVYNHLKDKVKTFLKPFAESGEPVGAEDIKAYFAKLRGDAETIRSAGGAALTAGDSSGGSGDGRKEQNGK